MKFEGPVGHHPPTGPSTCCAPRLHDSSPGLEGTGSPGLAWRSYLECSGGSTILRAATSPASEGIALLTSPSRRLGRRGHLLHPVGSTDERFTPPEIFALRDRVWNGGADTDPCWDPRSFSRARYCFTKRDNGLRQRWVGRVWLNPPWSDVMPWLVRLLEHLRSGATEGMMLVRNDPSTAWFKLAARTASAICFLGERTRYWQWNPRRRCIERCGTPEFASVLFYFGPDADAFLPVFRAAGHVTLPLQEHSSSGTVAPMPASKSPAPRKSKLESTVHEHVREAIREHARRNPNVTLGELASALGSNLEALMTLRVRDLWPEAKTVQAKPQRNGYAKAPPRRAAAPKAARTKAKAPKTATATSSSSNGAWWENNRMARIAEVRKAIAAIGKSEFTASDVIERTGTSRQTVLRTLARIPEIQKIGNNKSAKYVVKQ